MPLMQTEESQSNPESATVPADVSSAVPPPAERAKLSRASRWHAGFVARFAFTSRQIRGMAVVLAIVVGVLGWRLVRDRAFISDPQPPEGSRSAELASRLDPNSATWQELVAIPTLGEKRAKAIVAYRDDWTSRHQGKPAFERLRDLAGVQGIGPAMLQAMEPHVKFPPPVGGNK